jgi:hypothetical protein
MRDDGTLQSQQTKNVCDLRHGGIVINADDVVDT